MFIDVDAQKHAEKGEQVQLYREPHRELEEDQVEGHGRLNARCQGRGKDVLNRSLRSHYPESFP